MKRNFNEMLSKTKFALGIIVFVWSVTSCAKKEVSDGVIVDEVFNLAEHQASVMIREIQLAGTDQENQAVANTGAVPVSPRTLEDGKILLVPSGDWTSGFFPGISWFLYEHTGDKKWLEHARIFSARIEREQWNAKTHDMGFKIYCSIGNGYRLTRDTTYKTILIQSARTLCRRFKPTAGILRSWDHNKDKWDCPVIIDNVMNLELLFAATRLSGDSSFYRVADSHARTTMKNHFRDDGSSYHVVDYDTITGEVRTKSTHQGYSDESAWSRGQAWGLYGFVMCYRETGNQIYLRHAEKIAQFLLNHPRLPDDLIPYWDLDAPSIPNEPRDASAAAIIASGLYELTDYTDNVTYKETADKIMVNLYTRYTSAEGQSKGFILLHNTGSKPSGSEIDVPLIYADYYFLEALLRKKKIDGKSSLNLTITD